MAGLSSLLEVFVSCGVEFGGRATLHGGKGLLLAGARKIGWASGGSASRIGRRFCGHSLSSRGLASGFGSVSRGRLGTYDPKAEYRSRTRDGYQQAMRCGSGVMRFNGPTTNAPANLFGRPGFDKPPGVLGRNDGHRFIKQQSSSSSSWSKSPRGHINYK